MIDTITGSEGKLPILSRCPSDKVKVRFPAHGFPKETKGEKIISLLLKLNSGQTTKYTEEIHRSHFISQQIFLFFSLFPSFLPLFFFLPSLCFFPCLPSFPFSSSFFVLSLPLPCLHERYTDLSQRPVWHCQTPPFQ